MSFASVSFSRWTVLHEVSYLHVRGHEGKGPYVHKLETRFT